MMGRIANLIVTASVAALLAIPAGAADFTLRIHTLVQSPHPYNDMAEYMKEKLEERSYNSTAIRIFNSGQLGQDPAVISEMGLGTIDLMISTTSNAVRQIPEYAVFTVPYLFTDMDQMRTDLAPDTPIFAH